MANAYIDTFGVIKYLRASGYARNQCSGGGNCIFGRLVKRDELNTAALRSWQPVYLRATRKLTAIISKV